MKQTEEKAEISEYEEVDIEEPIPTEELEILMSQAGPNEAVAKTRTVKKKIKKGEDHEEVQKENPNAEKYHNCFIYLIKIPCISRINLRIFWINSQKKCGRMSTSNTF